MKKFFRDIDDMRSTLVDWVPLFDQDYRYTMNMKAYFAISCVIGGIAILVGLGIFVFNDMPHSLWREIPVTGKIQTNSRCLVGNNHDSTDYTYKYTYTVNGESYQTEKAYCDMANGTKILIYNPSTPGQSEPIEGFGRLSVGLFIAGMGLAFIVFSFAVIVILHYFMKWIHS